MKALRMLFVTLMLMAVMIVPAAGASVSPGLQDTVSQRATTYVYVAKTGKKYHRKSCRYVKKSRTKLKLSTAKKRGYKACKVCKPPK